MTYEQRVKDILKRDFFDKISKTVTFKKRGTPNYNSRGELTSADFSTEEIKIVPFDITHEGSAAEAFGELKEGRMRAAVEYTVNVAKGDVFVIETEEWVVTDTTKHYLPGNTLTIVDIVRAHNLPDEA